MHSNTWIDAGSASELAAGKAKLLRYEGRQYALFRTNEGELFACDNACPHEGYPLLQGYTEGCLLTCAWHNFKFDLKDGSCVVGEEDVVVYPLRESGERLEIDLTPPGGAEHEERLWKSLDSALHENRLAQAARDAARLLTSGVSPGRIAAHSAAFDGRHAPWGSSHALPVAADVLRYFEDSEQDPLLPLMQTLELAAESGHRREPHPTLAPRAQHEESELLRDELLEAIEDEHMDDAESILRAAARDGVDFAVLEDWLLVSCCAHFLSFGHQLIYLSKVKELRAHCDADTYLEILVGLLRDIIYGTREDTLPPMAPTRKALDEYESSFSEWMLRQDPDSEDRKHGLAEFRTKVLDGRASALPASLAELLGAGTDRHAIARELVLAASERVLRFDPAIELDAGLRENWLHVTHTLTFASAVRSILRRSVAPHTLALLFHAAHFIQHKKPLDAAGGDHGAKAVESGRADSGPSSSPSNLAAKLKDSVRRGDRDAALGALHAHLDRHGVDDELSRSVEGLALEPMAVRPIRAAHILKTLLVGLEECRSVGDDPGAYLPLSAALAFACARSDERGMTRIAREATEFVREGRPPRRLTS